MNELKKYNKKIKLYNISIKITQIIIFILFILLWEYLSNNKIINPFIFSSPSKIIKCIISLYNQNNLFNHILITLYETLLSFILGTFLGLLIASIMWWNKFLARVIEPYLTILNSLPKIALGPILIIWAGASMKSIIIMALLISTIITVINTYQSFNNVDNIKIKLLKTFKASKYQIFKYLILPSSLSNIISSLKINISMSLIGVIMGEFLVSKSGIGYLIIYGSQIFNLDLVLTGTFILCFLAAIMFYIINKLDIYLLKKYNLT